MAISFGNISDNISEDRKKVEKLVNANSHQSAGYSIARYIHKYGIDESIKLLQKRWYKSLKQEFIDSSLFEYRKVMYAKKPSSKNCYQGKLDSFEYNSFEGNLNFVRLIAGLPKVINIDRKASVNCQKAAWCLTVNGKINHYIPKTYKCYSTGAASAASRSNLSLGYSAGQAILGLLKDEGKSNYSVGHRRWLLNPTLTSPGYGLTDKVMVVQVFGQVTDFRRTYMDVSEYEKRPITWPVSGYHPKFLSTKRFSFSLAKANFKSASIYVKKNGKSIRTTKLALKANYGNPTLVFDLLETPKAGDNFQITVKNVLVNGKTKRNYYYSTSILEL